MKDKVYFPGLNALRFFAALMVIVAHAESIKDDLDVANAWGFAWVRALGPAGVSLFFVLSGFLITYLLLVEHQRIGTIQIKRFYARRILRIWPLYYLTLIWAFFIFPKIMFPGGYLNLERNFVPLLGLHIFLLPNIAYALFPPLLGAAQLWSLGVEEQFYLFWPLVLRRFIQRIVPLSAIVIAIKVLVRWVLWLFAQPDQAAANTYGRGDPFGVAVRILDMLPVEYLMIGAILAYLVFQGRVQLSSRLVRMPAVFLGIAGAVALLVYRDFFGWTVLEGICDAIVIANIVVRPGHWRWLDIRPLRYLGTISYGIYMYHFTVIVFVALFTANRLGLAEMPILYNAALYPLAIGGIVLVAGLSYAFFETPFLRLKNRLALVKSGGTPELDKPPTLQPQPAAE